MQTVSFLLPNLKLIICAPEGHAHIARTFVAFKEQPQGDSGPTKLSQDLIFGKSLEVPVATMAHPTIYC